MRKLKMVPLLFSISALSCGHQSGNGSLASQNGNDSGLIASHRIVNKNSPPFYAICAQETGGWCSSPLPTYDAATDALTTHRNSTGHTDNSVSNDCPFATQNNYDSFLYENLRNSVSASSKDRLDQYLATSINPLYAAGIRFDSARASALRHVSPNFGGAGNVSESQVVLGGSTAGYNITVNVAGNASVKISMWFNFAQVPAGVWTVGGPGTATINLNCNGIKPFPPGCPEWFGQPVTITAQGINGRFPVWVSFN